MGHGEDIQEFEEWQGIEDGQDVDREDEYIDEDKFTTVTVESVGISRDGFTRPDNVDGVESAEPERQSVKMNERTDSSTLEKPAKKRPNGKSKKRNFRYESKEERSLARLKEKYKSRVRRKLGNHRR